MVDFPVGEAALEGKRGRISFELVKQYKLKFQGKIPSPASTFPTFKNLDSFKEFLCCECCCCYSACGDISNSYLWQPQQSGMCYLLLQHQLLLLI